MNRLYFSISILALGLSIGNLISNISLVYKIKSIALKLSLDEVDNHQREDLLYKECKNLDYIIDVLINKDYNESIGK